MARMKTIVVVGAGGLVGGGLVRALSQRGHEVVAVARRAASLVPFASTPGVRALVGDVGSEAAAAALGEAVAAAAPRVDAVVVSVNASRATMRLSDAPTAAFAEYLGQGLLAHLNAAKALVPRVADGGVYTAIGGASSDFVWPEHGHISVSQAAQRMMFRVLAAELAARPVALCEYVIAAMVHDGTGAQGVSADAVGADFADQLFAEGRPAVTRFPAKPGA
jgi:NAD(P)-dependent dehydrogenase (short-subunit alcohol dehydrogenase family)